MPTVAQIIQRHEQEGTYFPVDGIETFRLDTGEGEAILCIHGVPTSSFLYRKLIRALAKEGHRGISVDLPGFGLSDRPQDFDYSFRGFSDFLQKAIAAIGLKRLHLVVHDIGGPIGFHLASQIPQKIRSLTILNTWIDVQQYRKPLVMKPFGCWGLGEAELWAMNHFTWPLMFRYLGIKDAEGIPKEEINAYVDLLKRKDNGRAFLKVMRSFDDSAEFKSLCYQAVRNTPYPVQALWGAEDRTLSFERYGLEIKQGAQLQKITKLPARHFLQEEVWSSIAEKITAMIEKKS